MQNAVTLSQQPQSLNPFQYKFQAESHSNVQIKYKGD